jgi:signal transduction histidine kinase
VLRRYLLDAALALGLAVAGVFVGQGFYFTGGAHEKMISMFGGVDALDRALLVWWLFSACMIVGVVIRRQWPVVAFATVAVGAIGHLLDPRFAGMTIDVAVPILVYTVASLRSRWIALTVLAVAVAGEYLTALYRQLNPLERLLPYSAKDISLGKTVSVLMSDPLGTVAMSTFAKSFQVILLLVLAGAIGDGVRSRRAHLVTLEQRAADLEREQQQRAALAAAAERTRLTRELHDVIAHGLSVMVVQAQGAAAALERHPQRSATALQDIIGTGRASLAEMRRLLGMARRDPAVAGDASLEPQPGVGALPALVDRVRAAGTPVRLDIDGSPVPLPASVDLSAYRIVQEALTNTLKHAGPGASAAVRLAFSAEWLEVEVTDRGAGPAVNGHGANGVNGVNGVNGTVDGNGLRGIAERVGLLGGELAVGPDAAGGFRVCARLPVEAGR